MAALALSGPLEASLESHECRLSASSTIFREQAYADTMYHAM